MLARLIAAALFVTATALFLPASTTPAAAEVICKEKGFRGNGRTLSRLPGIDQKTKARMAWADLCKKLHSQVWCSTHLAKNKRHICNVGGCEFEATPCRNN